MRTRTEAVVPTTGAKLHARHTTPFLLGRRPALDGIRALAIIAVVGVHVSTILIPSLAGKWFVGGVAGVDVFFVLSGFLITSLLLEEHDRSRSIGLRSFYWRRILRLWPALYLLLIGNFIYSMVVHIPVGYTLRGDGLIAAYQSNWAWSLGWPVPFGLDNTWSLAVEEQFYLIWPIVLLLVLRWRDRLVPLVATGIMVASALWRWHLYSTTQNWISSLAETSAHLDGLMLGALIAWCLHRGYMPPRWAIRVATLPALGALCWMIQTAGPQIGLYDGGIPLVDVCAAVLILAALDSSTIVSKVLATRPARWLGHLSYSLYLWHPLVFSVAYLEWPSGSPWARLLGALAVSLSLASISYYLVEQPFLRLRNRSRVPAERSSREVAANR
jgi:peptidoglycan/LPS O-acetylase OafA/YrhL